MGWVNGSTLVGPAIGPVLGGILAQCLGWRAILWFLAIFAGVLMILLILTFPETGRNVVGNGSIPPRRWNRDLLSIRWAKSKMGELKQIKIQESVSLASAALTANRQIRFSNPLSTSNILREKYVALLLLLYNCFVYSAYYGVTSSLSYLFSKIYSFNSLHNGLFLIPYGVGALLASLFNGRILDWRFRRVAKTLGIEILKGRTTERDIFPLERIRLPIAFVLILIGNTSLLCYERVSDSVFQFWSDDS